MSELEGTSPGVRGHRGVKGWAEGKKNVGNRNQSIWGALVGARSHGAFKATRGAVLDSEKMKTT